MVKNLKRIWRFITNKNVVIGFLIFLQIILFFVVIALSIAIDPKIGLYILIILFILSYIVALYILSRSSVHAPYKLTWVASILLFPIFGGIFYLYYNVRNYSKKQRIFYDNTTKRIRKLMAERDQETSNQIHNYLGSHGWATYHNTKVEFFQSGEDVLSDIINNLKNAKKFIFIEFFIIREGKIWSDMLEILSKKVKEGVEVKVIYDDWGSFTLPFRYYKRVFKKYGIDVINFNPVVPRVNFQMNFRNHRKLVIIDGEIGYTGGFNIADEYANLIERFGYWLDTGIKVTGDAVFSMSLIFLSDWEFRTKKEINFTDYDVNHQVESNSQVAPYADSPLINSTLTQDVLLRMIGQAKNKIYLSSPYLIIDPELSNALSLLARSGVEVNIVIPRIPDKKFVYMVSESYIPELVKNGVNIYKYNPGFIHSKVFMVDNKIASIGSSNLDYRSLFLHFENNVVFNDKEALDDIETFFLNAIDNSTLVDLQTLKKRNIFYRALQNILRGFSALL